MNFKVPIYVAIFATVLFWIATRPYGTNNMTINDLTIQERFVNFFIYKISFIIHYLLENYYGLRVNSVDYYEDPTGILYSSFRIAERVRLWAHNDFIDNPNDNNNVFKVDEIDYSDFSKETFALLTNQFTLPLVIRNVYNEPLLNQWNSTNFLNNFDGEYIVNTAQSADKPLSLCYLRKADTVLTHRGVKGCWNSLKLSHVIENIINVNNSNYSLHHTLLPAEKFIKDFDMDNKYGKLGPLAFRAYCGSFFGRTEGYFDADTDTSDTFGTFTPYHNAFIGNIFVNIEGRKKWILIDPSYEVYLRPMQQAIGWSTVSFIGYLLDGFLTLNNKTHYEFIMNQSNNDIKTNLELKQSKFIKELFPHISWEEYESLLKIYKSIPKYQVTLNPGDVIFNSPFWWHRVHNIPTNIPKNIRTNKDIINIAMADRFFLPIPLLYNNPLQFIYGAIANFYIFKESPYVDGVKWITAQKI